MGTGMTIICTWNDSGYALVIPLLNNGRARVYINGTNQARFNNNTFIL